MSTPIQGSIRLHIKLFFITSVCSENIVRRGWARVHDKDSLGEDLWSFDNNLFDQWDCPARIIRIFNFLILMQIHHCGGCLPHCFIVLFIVEESLLFIQKNSDNLLQFFFAMRKKDGNWNLLAFPSKTELWHPNRDSLLKIVIPVRRRLIEPPLPQIIPQTSIARPLLRYRFTSMTVQRVLAHLDAKLTRRRTTRPGGAAGRGRPRLLPQRLALKMQRPQQNTWRPGGRNWATHFCVTGFLAFWMFRPMCRV